MNPHRATASLIAAGEDLRAAKARGLRLKRRIAFAMGGIGIVLSSAALSPTPRLIWNASASAPIGLYWVSPGASLVLGDMVIARLPAQFRKVAAERRYLPETVPLVKRVAAYAGDNVCAFGQDITIDGRPAAWRLIADSKGRLLPTWYGCVRLRGSQIFLLNANPQSFDGRYFGVTGDTDVLGKASPLWLR